MGLAPSLRSVQQCRALRPYRVRLYIWVGGLASVTAIVHVFFICLFFICVFLLNYQHCKRLLYTSWGTGIFFFKPILERVVFSLKPFHGQVGLEITNFGMGCNFFCLSIQGFWTWKAKNFVKNQPCT
jgi:hypothetical protein